MDSFFEEVEESFVIFAPRAVKCLARTSRQESSDFKGLVLITICLGSLKFYKWINSSRSDGESAIKLQKAQTQDVMSKAAYSGRHYVEMKAAYKEVGLLKRENEDLSNEIQELNEENRQLCSENDDLQNTIITHEAESEKMEVTNNQLNRLLNDSNDKIKRRNREIKDLKTSYKQLELNHRIDTQAYVQQINYKDNDIQRLKIELDHFKSLGANSNPECNICWTKRKNVMAFTSCGHTACCNCASKLTDCHICRKKITRTIKLYF